MAKGIPYTESYIFDRDGGRCHICARCVDPTLSGNAPMGPTIDHLIPCAEGGIDGAENVALAHRACNVNRNTGGVAQLRLIA
jgi:5-methylcytosine-specific restriction endonuclease McrA